MAQGRQASGEGRVSATKIDREELAKARALIREAEGTSSNILATAELSEDGSFRLLLTASGEWKEGNLAAYTLDVEEEEYTGPIQKFMRQVITERGELAREHLSETIVQTRASARRGGGAE